MGGRSDALLAELKAQTQAAIADIRRLVYDLRPPALDDLGLIPAIREQATRYSQNGLHVSVDAPAQLPPLPAAVEVAAYRIVSEALANAVRHGGAANILVRLQRDREWLRVEVSDDGTGIDPDATPGVGLASMRARAEELGGSFTAGPADGAAGTTVTALLPLSVEEDG